MFGQLKPEWWWMKTSPCELGFSNVLTNTFTTFRINDRRCHEIASNPWRQAYVINVGERVYWPRGMEFWLVHLVNIVVECEMVVSSMLRIHIDNKSFIGLRACLPHCAVGNFLLSCRYTWKKLYYKMLNIIIFSEEMNRRKIIEGTSQAS